jgi:hypothetical protein
MVFQDERWNFLNKRWRIANKRIAKKNVKNP